MYKSFIFFGLMSLFLVFGYIIPKTFAQEVIIEDQTQTIVEEIFYGKQPTGELELKKEIKVNSEFERLQLEKLDKIISLLQSLRALQQK